VRTHTFAPDCVCSAAALLMLPKTPPAPVPAAVANASRRVITAGISFLLELIFLKVVGALISAKGARINETKEI